MAAPVSLWATCAQVFIILTAMLTLLAVFALVWAGYAFLMVAGFHVYDGRGLLGALALAVAIYAIPTLALWIVYRNSDPNGL